MEEITLDPVRTCDFKGRFSHAVSMRLMWAFLQAHLRANGNRHAIASLKFRGGTLDNVDGVQHNMRYNNRTNNNKIVTR